MTIGGICIHNNIFSMPWLKHSTIIGVFHTTFKFWLLWISWVWWLVNSRTQYRSAWYYYNVNKCMVCFKWGQLMSCQFIIAMPQSVLKVGKQSIMVEWSPVKCYAQKSPVMCTQRWKSASVFCDPLGTRLLFLGHLQ